MVGVGLAATLLSRELQWYLETANLPRDGIILQTVDYRLWESHCGHMTSLVESAEFQQAAAASSSECWKASENLHAGQILSVIFSGISTH